MKNRYSITRWLLTAAVPALLLTACSKDNDTGDYPGTNESPGGDIRFEIGFATPAATAGANLPQTRVTTDSQFKSTWDDGDAIGIFACRKSETLSETPSGNVLNNIKLTYNNATGTWSGSAYWPADGSRIDFYAYYPYQGDGTPLPSFCGEPRAVTICGSQEDFTAAVWYGLHAENRVSLFTAFIDRRSGEVTTRIVNRNQNLGV